jgi:hypothetical protein
MYWYYARNNPQDFLEVINDPELKLMGTDSKIL